MLVGATVGRYPLRIILASLPWPPGRLGLVRAPSPRPLPRPAVEYSRYEMPAAPASAAMLPTRRFARERLGEGGRTGGQVGCHCCVC